MKEFKQKRPKLALSWIQNIMTDNILILRFEIPEEE